MKKYLLVIAVGIVLTIALANVVADVADQFFKVESTGITKTAQRSYILADDGTVLTRLYMENREDIPLTTVPNHVQKAFIAIEDERFYKHHGVDYLGIARALINNIKHREVVEGGSTITQQYVKNSIGDKDKTITRKIKEAILASRLEDKYPKEKILEAYLNTIYFGQGAYGIEAAAEVFFNKKAKNLTLAEGALLAGVTKSPSSFSPYTSPDRAFVRQAVVLNRMAELGYITKAEAEAAKTTRPQLAKLKVEQVTAPYFVEHVKKELIKEYGVDKVFKGGLRVHTTLNLRAQKFAERAVESELYLKKDPEAALVSLNPQNGRIMAMVGGRDFKQVRINLATQGKRQPGSSFKTFALVAALQKGITANDMFDGSAPQIIRISKNRYVKPWKVNNCEGHGGGPMTLRAATEHSVNAAYANLTMKVGAEAVVKAARDMGIKTKLDAYPSIGIGGLTIGVSPLEMASAYGTLANGGVYVEPTAITKIVDGDGKVIKVVKPKSKKVLDPKVAYRAVDILRGVMTRGTATRANIGRPAAGKTGTNQAYRDAWFVGFTPKLSTAVWMGHPKAQVSMYNVHGSRAYGGHIPAKIWRKYMSKTLKGTPYVDFPKASWPKGGGGYYKGSGSKYYQAGTNKSKRYYRSRRSTSYSRRSLRSESSNQNQSGSSSYSGQSGTQGNQESNPPVQQAPQAPQQNGGGVVAPQSTPPQTSPQVQSVPDHAPAYGRRAQEDSEEYVVDD